MKDDRENEHYSPVMPEVSCQHLLDFFFEVGPVISTGMGAAPLDHIHLRAWQADTGIVLRPWEARFMTSLSREWLDESHAAGDPFRDPPWADAPYVRPKPERLLAKIKATL